uniref:LysR family transcriptional regulator n=1 Tax=Roseomonas rosulenta TaxID=2748667 RepID=UPI0018DFD2EF
ILRLSLPAARRGSTLGAAKALGIGQATAARRVAALEEALGQTLFERRQDGYRPTPAAQALLPAAEAMERAAAGFADAAAALNRGATGTLRVTTIDMAASFWVLPELPDFHRAHPNVQVELLTTEERLDITRGEAEIGLRFGRPPEEPGLVVRRLGTLRMGLFCSEAYAKAHGLPARVEEMGPNHAIVRGSGYIDSRPYNAWLAARAPKARIAHRASSGLGILEAIRAGVGIGWLPCGFGEEGLIRLFPPPPELDAGAFLVTGEALRRLPHVRAFIDFFVPRIAARLRRAA